MSYQRQIDTALRLISKAGGDAVVTRRSAGTLDAVADTDTGASTSHTLKAVGIAPGKSAEFRIGSLVNRSIMLFYFALKGASIEPTTGDRVTWRGATYRLIWADVLSPDGGAGIIVTAYGEV